MNQIITPLHLLILAVAGWLNERQAKKIEFLCKQLDLLRLSFLRGDVNGDGQVSALTDALYLLMYAFSRGDAPPCMNAADVNDSGAVSALLDSMYLLRYAFVDGPEPPAPGVDECGVDRTRDDELGCLKVEECE